MDLTQFRSQRESDWRRLEQFAQGRRHSFKSSENLIEFITLYRKVSSDLSFAQTYFPNDPLTAYLNALVAMSHHRLYRNQSGGFLQIWRFYRTKFPQLFRELRGYVILSALISLLGALYGYVLVWVAPLEVYHLLPASLVNHLDPAKAGPHAVNAPLMSSLIMTHNIMVALSAFLGGITAGIYTLYALWLNGLMIGTLAALFAAGHRSVIFWSLIVPHGVTELLAIFIAGGAGLQFAHRLVSPGPLRRGAAVRLAAAKSAQLMLGTVPMFIIAGTIEGFITPSALPVSVKFSIAAAFAILWFLYFSRVGRGVKRQTAASDADTGSPRPQPDPEAGIRPR